MLTVSTGIVYAVDTVNPLVFLCYGAGRPPKQGKRMSSRYLFLVPQLGAVLIALLIFAVHAQAAEVTVRVSGLVPQKGEVGCALFVNSAATAFPMDNSVARQLWLPVDTASVTCRFNEVPDGTYAISVAHDLNGNKKVDTNLLGIPTEAWGVSNNVRPTMRSPRFDEAAFKVEAGKDVLFDVRVAK